LVLRARNLQNLKKAEEGTGRDQNVAQVTFFVIVTALYQRCRGILGRVWEVRNSGEQPSKEKESRILRLDDVRQ
jgi:hypothetical protein